MSAIPAPKTPHKLYLLPLEFCDLLRLFDKAERDSAAASDLTELMVGYGANRDLLGTPLKPFARVIVTRGEIGPLPEPRMMPETWEDA